MLGRHDLDDMLGEREKMNDDLRRLLDEQTGAWGIKIANVGLKHVDLNESMARAIARHAEAERHRRARIIDAGGELQAAERLRDAARILGTEPQAMQLRYLGTLMDIAGERNSTIVFPLPIEFLEALRPSPPPSR